MQVPRLKGRKCAGVQAGLVLVCVPPLDRQRCRFRVPGGVAGVKNGGVLFTICCFCYPYMTMTQANAVSVSLNRRESFLGVLYRDTCAGRGSRFGGLAEIGSTWAVGIVEGFRGKYGSILLALSLSLSSLFLFLLPLRPLGPIHPFSCCFSLRQGYNDKDKDNIKEWNGPMGTHAWIPTLGRNMNKG